jgi:hypothetical protein
VLAFGTLVSFQPVFQIWPSLLPLSTFLVGFQPSLEPFCQEELPTLLLSLLRLQ